MSRHEHEDALRVIAELLNVAGLDRNFVGALGREQVQAMVDIIEDYLFEGGRHHRRLSDPALQLEQVLIHGARRIDLD